MILLQSYASQPKCNTLLMGVLRYGCRILQQFRQLSRLHMADALMQWECQVVERNNDFIETVGNGLGIPQIVFIECLQSFVYNRLFYCKDNVFRS